MVCKWTHITIFTTVYSIGEGLTKLRLVLFRMVKILYSIMATETGVSVLTLTIFDKVWAQFGYVVCRRSSSISLLALVIVKALFGVVSYLYSARLGFKCHQIQMQNRLLFRESRLCYLFLLKGWTTVKSFANNFWQKTQRIWLFDFANSTNLELRPQLGV